MNNVYEAFYNQVKDYLDSKDDDTTKVNKIKVAVDFVKQMEPLQSKLITPPPVQSIQPMQQEQSARPAQGLSGLARLRQLDAQGQQQMARLRALQAQGIKPDDPVTIPDGMDLAGKK